MKIKNKYHKKISFNFNNLGPFSINEGEEKEVDRDLGEKLLQSRWIKEVKRKKYFKKEDYTDFDLKSLGLPDKIIKTLKDNNVNTLKELKNKSNKELNNMKGIGKKSLKKIEEEINNK